MLKASIQKISFTSSEPPQTVLQNFSFTLSHNKIYTILGQNGSGKSTLIKSLTGLLNNSICNVEGEVFWNDINLLSTDNDKLLSIRKNNIRYVFQDSVNSFDHLKKINYYFSKSNAEKNAIDQILEYFLLPSYEKISTLHPYEVSGGMAQRLSLVIALLAKPDLLILDEPTSAIDVSLINLMVIKLKEFVNSNQRSALIVTQDLNFAEKISDDVAEIKNGTLKEFVPAKTFFSKL